jgi:hypothetical protein
MSNIHFIFIFNLWILKVQLLHCCTIASKQLLLNQIKRKKQERFAVIYPKKNSLNRCLSTSINQVCKQTKRNQGTSFFKIPANLFLLNATTLRFSSFKPLFNDKITRKYHCNAKTIVFCSLSFILGRVKITKSSTA